MIKMDLEYFDYLGKQYDLPPLQLRLPRLQPKASPLHNKRPHSRRLQLVRLLQWRTCEFCGFAWARGRGDKFAEVSNVVATLVGETWNDAQNVTSTWGNRKSFDNRKWSYS